MISFINSCKQPDLDLQNRVGMFLRQQGTHSGCQLDVTARDGVVHLSGWTPTYYQRQMLVTLASKVVGVLRVIDGLQVEQPKLQQLIAAATI